MKNLIITILLSITASAPAHAQTVKEWTEQKKTQLEYLVKQIAALQSYAEVAAKGYAIVQGGLTTIQNIKKEDFAIHADYFGSLKKVNPKVKSYWKVAATIALQIQILKQCKKQRTLMQESQVTGASQVRYYNSVVKNLLNGCDALIEDLTDVLLDVSLQMKDNERMERIDRRYAAMQERSVFLQHFCSQYNVLGIQRKHEATDSETLRALYSLN